MAAYEVLGMYRRADIDELGNFRWVYHIDFKTAKGVISFIRIPVEQYTPEAAKRMLAQEAQKLDAVFS